MPIYEYQCQACTHKMEALQKLSDAPLVSCPACGKDSLSKLISAAAFKLKGTGWYETDFKSKAKTPSTEKTPDSTSKKANTPVSSPSSIS